MRKLLVAAVAMAITAPAWGEEYACSDGYAVQLAAEREGSAGPIFRVKRNGETVYFPCIETKDGVGCAGGDGGGFIMYVADMTFLEVHAGKETTGTCELAQ